MDNLFIKENRSNLINLMYLSLLILITVVGILLWRGKYNYLMLLAAAPIVLLIITNPKLALYQYIFSIFMFFTVNEELHISLIDLSALLLILSALFDFLFSKSLPKSFPRLFINFLLEIIDMYSPLLSD